MNMPDEVTIVVLKNHKGEEEIVPIRRAVNVDSFTENLERDSTLAYTALLLMEDPDRADKFRTVAKTFGLETREDGKACALWGIMYASAEYRTRILNRVKEMLNGATT